MGSVGQPNEYLFAVGKTAYQHQQSAARQMEIGQQHIFTNHYKWDNDFSKISTTKVEGSLSIPRWKLDASVGYALLSNNIYYDTLGIVRQNTKPMSVLTASLRKDFSVWKFHFDNQALLQFSSEPNVMPLPLLALNLRYYFQLDVVKFGTQSAIHDELGLGSPETPLVTLQDIHLDDYPSKEEAGRIALVLFSSNSSP